MSAARSTSARRAPAHTAASLDGLFTCPPSVRQLIARVQPKPFQYWLAGSEAEQAKQLFLEQAELNEGEWLFEYQCEDEDGQEEGEEEEEEEEVAAIASGCNPYLHATMKLTALRIVWFAGGREALYGLYTHPEPAILCGAVVVWCFSNTPCVDLHAPSVSSFARGHVFHNSCTEQRVRLNEQESSTLDGWLTGLGLQLNGHYLQGQAGQQRAGVGSVVRSLETGGRVVRLSTERSRPRRRQSAGSAPCQLGQ